MHLIKIVDFLALKALSTCYFSLDWTERQYTSGYQTEGSCGMPHTFKATTVLGGTFNKFTLN